jgi:hypothetical protein
MILEKPKNRYIEKHKDKNKNDVNYTLYEKWCMKKGEIPMNKESVLKEVEDKEKQIKSML